jgi:hypothetical protein
MSGIDRILLVYLNQCVAVVINLLNETDRIFILIDDFNISAPAKIPAGAFTLVAATAA